MFETDLMINHGIVALGAMALYLLLPKGGRSTRTAGVLFALAAVASVGFRLLSGASEKLGPKWSFYLFATLAVVFSAAVIVQRKAVYSALYLVLVVMSVASLCLLLQAEFLAVSLVIIYAGAILVTYMFVIMLAQQSREAVYDRWARSPLAACFAGFVFVAAIGAVAASPGTGAPPAPSAITSAEANTGAGSTEQIGLLLLTRYVVVLEVAGILLLLAMVGAIAIARKRFPADASRRADVNLGKVGREAAPF